MPSDWLFYWMTRPSGLLLIALAIAIPFVFWRLVLGKEYEHVGVKPLAMAYAFAAVGLVCANFMSSYLEFSSRVAGGVLQEERRWPTVYGWTIYTTVLSLIFTLPLLGCVAVPLAATLLRLRRLTYASVAIAVVTAWLALVGIAWAFPDNEWHRTHRLESFTMWLKGLLPGVALVAVPFLLGIYRGSRSYRRSERSGT